MNMLEHASRLTGEGFHVFKLAGGTKVPIKDSRGFKDATKDPSQLGLKDFHNLGIATGKFNGTQALIVVDVDMKNGKDGLKTKAQLEADGKPFPKTRTQHTPNGGIHLIYSYNRAVQSGECLLGDGVDIKSRDGYIVGAPSKVREGVYSMDDEPIHECPQWIVDILDALDREEVRPKESFLSLVADIDQVDATLNCVEWLSRQETAVSGERNMRGLRAALKLRDYGLNYENTFSIMSRNWKCEPMLDSEELNFVINSAWRYGKNSPGVSAPELMFTDRDVGNDGKIDPEKVKGQARVPLFLKLARDCVPDLNQTYLVEGCLPLGGLSVLWGESNTGKTFVALDLMYKLALGKQWFGKDVMPGPVVYVAAEAGKSISSRIHAFNIEHDLVGKDTPIGIIPCPVDLYRPSADVGPLIDLIKSFHKRPSLVIVDTLARVMAGGNENDAADMGRLVAHFDAIRTATESHVMVVHHCGKKGDLRGSSALIGAVDTEIEVRSNRTIRVGKNREYVQDSRAFAFGLKKISVGVNAKGQEVSSCVISETEEIGDMPNLDSAEAALAFEMLGSVFMDHAMKAPERWKLDASYYFVSIKEWRKAFIEKHCADKDSRQQKYAWRKVMDEVEKLPNKYKMHEEEAVILSL